MKEAVTRLNYCQYLLVSQINYTLTNFADHCESFSHDAINRYLRGERITPRLVWDNVRGQVVATAQGYVVREMLSNIVYQKQLPCHAVLMDTWYATKALMLFIESLAKIDYCPLKNNRQVDDSDGQRPYGRVDALPWGDEEQAHGTQIKIKGFPRDHKVRLFRVEVSTHRTDWVVTNDPTQDSTAATQQVCGFRGKIEQLHREGKQLTGLERCQCRKARIQRNPIGCAFLVWVRLKELATQTGRTVYPVKYGLLDEYCPASVGIGVFLDMSE